MRVLIACEFSGRIREAFRLRGHDAWSCDLIDTEIPGPHIIGDVLNALYEGWDLMIGHPPCTNLAVSGARWFKDKTEAQQEDVKFFKMLWGAPIPRIALENPVSVLSTIFGKPTQIVHPWQFGHGVTKPTCLWLKNLPLLKPTFELCGWHSEVHKEPPGPDRWKNRSRTYQGLADAMADQWGGYGK